MSATRTSSRRPRVLPARYQDQEPTPSTSIVTTSTTTTVTTTTTTTATTIAPPRGRKRSRSPTITRSKKRPSSQHTESQLESLQSDITLKLTASPTVTNPPRITVPLDIDTTHTQLPSYIDMNTDYWTIWRHVYDKWRIQEKFAIITASVAGVDAVMDKGVNLARNEIDRLYYVREKLLTDHPDRQDIDLRNRYHVKHVWKFLSTVQSLGDDVAKFNCQGVASDMGWDGQPDDEAMWDQIGAFLIEEGNEGRIFIDPREYYDHYSWCVEDLGRPVTNDILKSFYQKFATKINQDETTSCDVIEGDTPSSTEYCQCGDVCLLCLPQTDAYLPVSPLSSLPSPPRTPGTQSLQSYFKGRRLSHPPLKSPQPYTNDDAVNILLSFAGIATPPSTRQKRPKRSKSNTNRTQQSDFNYLEIS
jgi:hypothetical protein